MVKIKNSIIKPKISWITKKIMYINEKIHCELLKVYNLHKLFSLSKNDKIFILDILLYFWWCLLIVYLDLVILINFVFDLFLLVVVNKILKRNAKMLRMILGSLLGGISIIALFIPFNTITLFLFKVAISVVMLIISFGYKDTRYFFKNFIHLYLVSMLLGGFMYFLNIQLSYDNKGLIFFHKGLSINIIAMFIIGPLILISYIKENKSLKLNYNNYYTCELFLNKNHRITVNAFLDTGNKLKDPYSGKSIILLNKELFDEKKKTPIYVPYNTLNNHGLLRCYKVDKMIIENKIARNFLIGISDEKIKLDGIDCIINLNILEEIRWLN